MTSTEIVEQNAAPPPSNALAIIADAVTNPAVDPAKMEALLRIQRDLESDAARREFNAAMLSAQRQIPAVEKNGVIDMGSKGKMAFAKLEDVMHVLRPIMESHGFSVDFDAQSGVEGRTIVSATLMHAGGHSKTVSIPLPLDTGAGRNNLQAMGSTLSYGRRYLLEMLFNIVRKGVDDDGKAGGTEYVNAEERDKIDELLKETNADRERFLLTMGVESVALIPAGAYKVALNLLSAKRARQATK